MHTCPHCSQRTVSAWQKVRASSGSPARCFHCHGLSYLPGWVHLITSATFQVIVIASVYVALQVRSWLVLVALAIPLTAGLFWAAALFFPLRPIESTAYRKARRVMIIQVALLVVLGVGAIAYTFLANGGAT